MSEKILEVRQLATSFHTERGWQQAIDGVSFDVYQGEILGIVGESGSGKSVTAYSVMQILAPTGKIVSGSVKFDGQELVGADEKLLRSVRGNRISIIFQDPMTSLNPTYTIGRQLMEAILLHTDRNRHQARERAVEMLKLVNVNEPEKRMKQYPFELSGGMRQRVMIAMALACEPDILIADEPTTALDVTIQAQIMRLLKQLQEKMGTSIILITHDLGIVAQIAKHVMVMYCGQAVEYSDVRSIYKNPLHPYTAGLLRSIPKLTDDDMEELPSIPGMVPSPSEKLQGCRFAPRCEKCGARCKKEMPDLVTLEDGRKVRCFLYEGGVEG